MPITKRLLTLAVLPTMLLTACGGSSSSTKSSSSSTSSTTTAATHKAVTGSKLSDVTVDEKKPSISIPKDKLPFGTANVETKTLTAGTGKAIGAKDLVNLDYVMVDGYTGKQADSSIGKVVTRIDMSQSGSYLPGLIEAIKGAKVGSTLLTSIPSSKAFGAAGASQLGITGGDDLVVYLHIKSSAEPLTQATGTPQTPDKAFPGVEVPPGTGKEAKITFPAGLTKPTETTSETLVSGSGDTVAKGDTISVSYTGQVWGGSVFDSTAKHNDGGKPTKFAIGIGQVIPGWDKALVGKKVGDRVVIVVPSKDGYGSTGSPKDASGKQSVKPNETLVFVVDILADYGYVQSSTGN